MAINLRNVSMPAGWAKCSLSEFARIVMGQSPPSNTYNHDAIGLPFFQGKAEFGQIYPRVDKYCSEPNKIAEPGATLLSVRAPVGPTNLAQEKCCIGRGLAAIHPLDDIAPKFLLLLFRSIEPDISEKGTGSTFKAVTKAFVENLEFALPPVNEQRRILAKIEELFSELDKGVENLETAREQLKVYRQAVLKHAFEGKFTEQWREENRDKLECPDKLMARIKQERESHYQQQLSDWKNAVKIWVTNGHMSKKPGKPRVPEAVTSLRADILESLPKIPSCWTWIKLGWTTCGVEYGTATKSSESGVVPVIRMGNIQNARIDWSDLVYTSDSHEIEKYMLAAGDVLFNRTNSPELVGKTAIYRGERPAVFAGYLIRLNQISSIVDSQYLNLFLNSHIARQYGNAVKTDGVNQSNINGEKLQGYPFPYCSLAEQQEVVRVVDEKLSLTDRIISDINAELIKATALRQAILKKAFSGQLLSQDPSDEPASVLLERIKSDKASGQLAATLGSSRKKPISKKRTTVA